MTRSRSSRRPAAQPSGTASRRLRSSLREEIAELRVRLEEASLRSELHLRTGDRQGAQEAVRDQEELLEAFHVRVRHRVADALIERDAEGVLRDAVADLERSGQPVGEFAAPQPARARPPLAAALAALAALLTTLLLPAGTTGIRAPHEASQHSISNAPSSAAADTARTPDRRAGDAASSVRPQSSRTASTRDVGPVTGPADAPDSGSFLESLLRRLLDAVSLPTAVPGVAIDDLAEELRAVDTTFESQLEVSTPDLTDLPGVDDGGTEDTAEGGTDSEPSDGEPSEADSGLEPPSSSESEQDSPPAPDGDFGATGGTVSGDDDFSSEEETSGVLGSDLFE